MVQQQVEAVWVWSYNVSAQKATYGRFTDNPADRSYTKDYLQASGQNGNLLASKFPAPPGTVRFDLTYHWPLGTMAGFLTFSVDRQHLSWPTGGGAPVPWRMAPSPAPLAAETFPGNPSAKTQTAADAALAAYQGLGISGVLVAIKLYGEPTKLHVRAYIDSPPAAYLFASTAVMPNAVRSLTVGFGQRKACQSESFLPGVLFFDPMKNHDAWSTFPAAVAPGGTGAAVGGVAAATSGPVSPVPGNLPRLNDDSAAEAAPFDSQEVLEISRRVESGDFSVPDLHATTKTRGSAQRVFSAKVKRNYGGRCAITGISTGEFLVASHIVPWSEDETIRIDPSNGICLSTLVDRAFDAGFLTIGVDLVVRLDHSRLEDDSALASALMPYDGVALRLPTGSPPNSQYLQRRLALP